MRATWSLLLLGAAACGTPPPLHVDGDVAARAHEFIAAMGDPAGTVKDHYRAYEELVTLDKAAVPCAIEALEDDRVFNAAAPQMGSGPDLTVRVTVGDQLTVFLYERILRVHGRSRFRVDDWRRWWRDNSGKTIDQWRADVAAFDKTHGLVER